MAIFCAFTAGMLAVFALAGVFAGEILPAVVFAGLGAAFLAVAVSKANSRPEPAEMGGR